MRAVVLIPTYNEVLNIREVLEGILARDIEGLEILVVDDDSPDGTAAVVEEMAASDARVRLLLRRHERGRGRAGREGFLAALEAGADLVIEMDGDGSHRPEDIEKFIASAAEADVVLGSRFVPGGEVLDRGFHRDLLSNLAKWYVSLVLGLDYSDPTTGFRAFTRSALERIDPKSLLARDPFIVTEVLYRAHRGGLRVREIPIVFCNRRHGVSKLKLSVLLKYFYRVVRLRFAAPPPDPGAFTKEKE